MQLRTTNSAGKKTHIIQEARRAVCSQSTAQPRCFLHQQVSLRPITALGVRPRGSQGSGLFLTPPSPSPPSSLHPPLLPGETPGCCLRSRLTHWRPLCRPGHSSTPRRCPRCLGSCGRDFRSARQGRRHSRGTTLVRPPRPIPPGDVSPEAFKDTDANGTFS